LLEYILSHNKNEERIISLKENYSSRRTLSARYATGQRGRGLNTRAPGISKKPYSLEVEYGYLYYLEGDYMFGMFKKKKEQKSGFPTIALINRLISAGAEREFVTAVSAIWFVQAANDPNTQESQQLAGGILGTLENIFVEEARATDVDVFELFTSTINNSEYGALFEESQPIYTIGREEVNEKFPPGSAEVMEVFSYYANVMGSTTKQNKENLLNNLQTLSEYVDKMCGLANQAEKDLF